MKYDCVIVMPLYQNEDTLPVTLESILNQDYSGKVLTVFALDKCKDKTEQIATMYRHLHPGKFHLITSDSRMGLGGARKAAMDYIKTLDCKYILSLDGDDNFEPHALKRIVEAMEETGCDCLNFSFYEVKQGKRKAYRFSKEKSMDQDEAVKDWLFDSYFRSFLWAKCFRKEAFLGPICYALHPRVMFEDAPLMASALSHCYKIVSIKDCLVNYRLDVASSSSSTPRCDRALYHLSSFALVRHYFEETGNEALLKAFFKAKARTRLSLLFDLSLDKKRGADTDYAKEMKKSFARLFKKKGLAYEEEPYYDIFKEGVIA